MIDGFVVVARVFEQMMAMLNGQERTHLQLKAVAAQAGWRPRKVYSVPGQSLKMTEFVKA